MHRRTSLVLAFLLAVALAVVIALPSAARANGCSLRTTQGVLGTAADPILVASAADLAALQASACFASNYVFRQTADIDLGGVGWLPIGRYSGFTGTYDGGGHVVTGLVVTEASAPGSGKGLFGYVNDGTIRNLTLRGASITGIAGYYGSLVGDMDGGLVEDVRVLDSTVTSTGTVRDYIGGVFGGASASSTIRRVTTSGVAVTVTDEHSSYVGGIVGILLASTVTDVTASATVVDSAGSWTGGIVGTTSDSTLSRVTSSGTVRGHSNVGGLVGSSCSAVSSSSSSAAVTATNGSVGGLIGSAVELCPLAAGTSADHAVRDSFATGTVTGTTDVGGLVGEATGLTIARVLATGAVTASSDSAGGLVGRLSGGAISDAYALGAVSSPILTGGLIGAYQQAVTVDRSYAAGRVTGTTSVGGLVGGEAVSCGSVGFSICSPAPTTIVATGSFWDAESSGRSTSAAGTSKTTAQLRELSTFTGAGWSAASGWSDPSTTTWGLCFNINGGRPFLNVQYSSTTNGCWTAPTVPRRLRASVGNGQVTIEWQAPASDGGSPVTGYTATATMQSQSTGRARPSCSVSATKRRCTITGLRNGRTYRVALSADSEVGVGTASTVLVTPRRALTVLSTERSGLSIVTRVRVNGAGVLTQHATPQSGGGIACRAATKRPKGAGIVTLTCALNATSRRALEDGALRLVVTTRFAPAKTSAETATDRITFARTQPTGEVTG